MFIEVTPKNSGGKKIWVNTYQIKAVMEDEMDDMIGSCLVFDIEKAQPGKDEIPPIGMFVCEDVQEIMAMIRGEI